MRCLLDTLTDGGWLPGEPTSLIRGLELSVPPCWPGGGVQSPASTDSIIRAYVMKPTCKPKRMESGNFQVDEPMEIWGEWQAQREHEALNPFPISYPMNLFHLAIPELSSYIINQ